MGGLRRGFGKGLGTTRSLKKSDAATMTLSVSELSDGLRAPEHHMAISGAQ